MDTSWHPHASLWAAAATAANLRSTSTSNSPSSQAQLSTSDDVAAPPSGIPRLIHHIWLGGNIPERLRRLIDTWTAVHPGWTHKIWRDADVDAILAAEPCPLVNREAFLSARNLGQRSDILRYEILFAFGGVYVDADMQCLGSFEDLCKGSDFFIGISNTSTWELNNAVIGCCPGHRLISRLVRQLHSTAAEAAVENSKASSSSAAAAGEVAQSSPSGASDASASTSFMDTIMTTGPWFVTMTLMPLLAAAWSKQRGGGTPALSADEPGGRAPASEAAESTSTAADRNRDGDFLTSAARLRALFPEFESTTLTSSDTAPAIATLAGEGIHEERPLNLAPFHPSRCVVLPPHVFYPAPNTLSLQPPEWTACHSSDDELFQAVYGAAALRNAAGPAAVGEGGPGGDTDGGDRRGPRGSSSPSWLARALPVAALPFIRPEAPSSETSTASQPLARNNGMPTLALHYWARTWQRKAAQL